MNFLQMEYFLTICKNQNVSKAADELFISRPSLSRAMKDLEEEFDVTLFHRSNSGLTLTEEGQYLYQNWSVIQHSLDNLYRLVNARSQTRDKSSVSVRIGLTPYSSIIMFPGLLEDAEKNSPHLQLTIHDCTREDAFSLLKNNEVDFVITEGEQNSSSENAFHSLRLSSPRLMLYVPEGHRLADRESVTPADFKDEPMAFLDNFCVSRKHIEKLYSSEGLIPCIPIHSGQILSIQTFIEMNMACCLSLEGIFKSPKLVSIPVEPVISYNFSVIWNKNSTDNDSLAPFLAYIKDYKKL